MPSRIEDYARLGDTRTAALVSSEGSVDWLCAPRFDSPACFAALLGTPEHGRFLLAPRGEPRRVERGYGDAKTGRLTGNFPQALSHIALVNSILSRNS